MDGKNWNAFEAKPESGDLKQLIHLGQELHDRAVFETLAGVISKLKSVLDKCVDYFIGFYRLKHN